MGDVADRGLLPGLVLLLLHHEAQVLLRRVRELGVLEDHLVEEEVQLGRAPGRPDRQVGVADVGRHRLHLRVLRVLRRVVDRDAVLGDADLVVEERLVVVRIEPGERSRHEGLIELLGVLERLQRLRAIDDDVVLLVDQLSAERPDEPMRPGVAVAGGVAEREADRMVLRLERLAELQEPRGVARETVEPHFLHLADAVDEGVARGAEGHADPAPAAGLEVLPANVVPAAVLLAQILGEIGHVEQLLGVEVRVVEGREDDVGAGADVRRHRRLGTHVLPALAVDTHFDAGAFAELGGVLHPHVLVALDEALPAQHAQLRALLGLPGLALGLGEQRHAARSDAGRDSQKIPAIHVAHRPSFGVMTFQASLVPLAGSKIKVSCGFSRTAAPGLQVWRSRTTAVTSMPASLQKICVSAPVGSTTTTSAGTPSSATAKCSGRTPTTTSRPSGSSERTGIGRCTPPPTATASPVPFLAMRPVRKFIAGEPMKPATNWFAGLS